VIADRAVAFPRSARLLTPRQFREVLAQGRGINTAQFRLQVLAEARRGDNAGNAATPTRPARLGVTVSKRVAPRAVQRNRIKRAVRESFRHQHLRLPPGDYLVQAQREAAAASPAALRDALAKLWQRAGALKPTPAAPTMPARVGSDGDSN
jgi:ribonuclease P protein component